MLRPLFAQLITSSALRRTREWMHDFRAVVSSNGNCIECFVGIDDPHSFLLAALMARHYTNHPLRLHLVRGPAAAFNPDPERRSRWALRDAHRIAPHYAVEFPDLDQGWPETDVVRFGRVLAALMHKPHPWPLIAEAGRAFWHGDTASVEALGRKYGMVDAAALSRQIDQGTARLQALGHYQPAMLFYRGSWYWGVDRLWHLKKRLAGVEPPMHWPRRTHKRTESTAEVDLFFSARSPYSYIALQRLMRLQGAGHVVIHPRPVLPMLMRGLAVPAPKRRYIIADAAREAARYRIPFGRIADPLGKPVERAYALVDYARREGHLLRYLDRFMRGVWSEGIDAGSDRGLRRIVEQSGLLWSRAKGLLDNTDWHRWEQENRQAMYSLGLWGVPSMTDGRHAAWGQDRLFLLGLPDP